MKTARFVSSATYNLVNEENFLWPDGFRLSKYAGGINCKAAFTDNIA